MAAFNDSTWPGQGTWRLPLQKAKTSFEIPAPSLPMMNAIGPRRSASTIEAPASATQAYIGIRFSARVRSSETFASETIGSRKLDPAEARSAFWFHGLTLPGVSKTPLAANASADRMIVPTLPGSCSPARMRSRGSSAASIDSSVHSGAFTSAAMPWGESVAQAWSKASAATVRTFTLPSNAGYLPANAIFAQKNGIDP